jgi:hypothetical protein
MRAFIPLSTEGSTVTQSPDFRPSPPYKLLYFKRIPPCLSDSLSYTVAEGLYVT